MQSSLFKIDFPIIETKKKLEKAKKKHPELDEYFIASGCIKKRKQKFNKLWQRFSGLEDNNFLQEIKTDFHARSWEMYIGSFLKEHFEDIKSKDSGPDFILNTQDKIFIEATACEKGKTKDSVPDMIVAEGPKNMIVQDVPEEKMLLRILNSLSTKSNKYKDFILSQESPFIIAINRAGLEHVDIGIPLILKCLFGLGYKQIKLKGGEPVDVEWSKRNYIKKKNGSKIFSNFFKNMDNSFVSAVVYSNKHVLNVPKDVGADCILVHNPKAKFPVDTNRFSFLEQWKANYSKTGLKIRRIS